VEATRIYPFHSTFQQTLTLCEHSYSVCSIKGKLLVFIYFTQPLNKHRRYVNILILYVL
jgi:hypothetical protein